jgi:putative sugar O-methyltransferase
LTELEVNSAIAGRLLAFMNSELFTIRSGAAKSEYWKYFAQQLQVSVKGDSVEVTGRSGFYVPQPASPFRRHARRLERAVRQPSKVVRWLGQRIASQFALPRLMSYESAFDAVMSSADVSLPIRSRFTLDHRQLARLPKVLMSVASLRRHYRHWSGNELSANIINHYYYQNILRGFIDSGLIRTVLEIGPGNGNFPSILYHDWAPTRIVLIDLPETLAVSIPFLSNLFPDARMAMPNEIEVGGMPAEFDFAFLTVDQLQLLPDDFIDLAINCHSFQEMTHAQIRVYLELIQRACRDSALFFCANRVEKIPCGPEALTVEQPDPPNRMAEYPWNASNELLAYEISKLSRLVQLDSVALRLERINKRRR